MERPLHVSLVGRSDPTLLSDLRALPGRPEVRSFDTLFGASAELLAFAPDVLILCVAETDRPEELAGALLLLRGIRPTVAFVLVAEPSLEVRLATVGSRVGAQFLANHHSPAQLLATIDQALAGGDRPKAEVFLDLVHGLADEINNPLMFLMGHLQLLQLQMPADQSRDALEQVSAALSGAQRVHASVDRMRRIERAAAGPRRVEPLDLAHEVSQCFLNARTKADPVTVLRDPVDASFVIQGDADILRPALSGLASLAQEFRDDGIELHASLTRLEGLVRVRLSLRGRAFADWSLPRTYEPYYLSRALRGTSQGLALFHLQAAAHGHRGRATARRMPDGAVAIDLEFPAR